MIWIALVLLWLAPVPSYGASYYIAPTGSNGNVGTSSAAPWLTFAHAFASTSCGDRLIVLNGVYGFGTSTGVASLTKVCTQDDPYTVTVLNERQARVGSSGTTNAFTISNSAYINLEGLVLNSTDENVSTSSGMPLYVVDSHHVQIKKMLLRNPNRYTLRSTLLCTRCDDILVEDLEAYVYQRHVVTISGGHRVVLRRVYGNPRGGRIVSLGSGTAPGAADAVVSFYPCQDCIAENIIFDGQTTPGYLAEMNANFGNSTLMSGSKILGSIAYKPNLGNAIYLASRPGLADSNYSPQHITVENVAIIDKNSATEAIRVDDGINITIRNVHGLQAGGNGRILVQDTVRGVASASQSTAIVNSVVKSSTGGCFAVTHAGTWTGDELFANGCVTAFNPSLPSNWTNTSTADPGMGTCKLWVPTGAAAKGAGSGGADIGANILYRYQNGVLTSVPLWDPVTAGFPHGAVDLDGTNAVAGQSLSDIHTRLNVNTGGCAFPAGYGSSGPTNPASRVSSTDLTGPHVHTVSATANRSLTVGVGVRHDGSAAAEPTGLTSSCGSESIPALGASYYTISGDRSLRLFGKMMPASGTCTLTPAFSNGNVSGWMMISAEELNAGSYGPVSAASGLSDTPAVTVTTNADETVLDFVATSNVPAVSVGANQIWTTEQLHATKVLRGVSSKKAGADGGRMAWVLGGNYGWISQAVSVVPPVPGGGSGSTFRVQNYRIYSVHGSPGTPEISVGPLGNQNQSAEIGITGAFRIRVDVLAETAASAAAGIKLFCGKNGASKAAIGNAFGGNPVRYYGSGVYATIPSSLMPTTERFAGGAFMPGVVVGDGLVQIVLPPMPANTSTELDFLLVAGNGVAPGDVVDCEIWRDDSSAPVGVHTETPQVVVASGRSSMGF